MLSTRLNSLGRFRQATESMDKAILYFTVSIHAPLAYIIMTDYIVHAPEKSRKEKRAKTKSTSW